MTDGPVPGSPESIENAPPPIPLTLVQHACDAQKLWASSYAQEHRIRRRVSWVIAAILAVYVGGCAYRILGNADMLQRLGGAVFCGYMPLQMIMHAARDRRDGDWPNSLWVAGWAILTADVALGSGLLVDGDYLVGVTFVLSALGIGAVLSWGLHIPDDPSVDWNLVLDEQLTVVRSARGGRSYLPVVDSPRKAEEIAAAWLRRLGYPDALVTPVGADDGVDVSAFGAVAQVKWTGRPIGAPDVRDLAGSGKPGQARFFFSKSGYTQPALRWAADPERPVRLFVMGEDGNIVARNYRAKRSLWRAPPHVPVAFRRPTSRWMPWVSITVGILSLMDAIVFAYMMMQTFFDHQVFTGILFGAMALALAAFCVPNVFLPAIRISGNIRRGEPPGIRESFSRLRPPEVDTGLPSDVFVGFEPSKIMNILDWGTDLWVHSRAMHRVFRGRALPRSPRLLAPRG
jgi:hypothetical protein